MDDRVVEQLRGAVDECVGAGALLLASERAFDKAHRDLCDKTCALIRAEQALLCAENDEKEHKKVFAVAEGDLTYSRTRYASVQEALSSAIATFNELVDPQAPKKTH